MAEKYYQPEEQKEEINYQHRSQYCDLFFSFLKDKKSCEGILKLSESLKNSRDFQKVYKGGKSYANRYLVMYIIENGRNVNRLGISVSKKVGNSVVRHRVTRLIRESYRLNSNWFHSGWDIVVIARTTAKGKGYQEICSALLHLGKLHKIIKEMIES